MSAYCAVFFTSMRMFIILSGKYAETRNNSESTVATMLPAIIRVDALFSSSERNVTGSSMLFSLVRAIAHMTIKITAVTASKMFPSMVRYTFILF